MLISPDDKKVVELKDYLQSKMPGMSVHAAQTGPDENEDVLSFFFHEKGSPAWRCRLKVTGQALADHQVAEIIVALESQHWDCRLEPPDGSVLVLKTDMRLEGSAC